MRNTSARIHMVISRIIGIATVIALLISTSLSLPLRKALAQGGKTITYDTPVESQLTDAAFNESWTLNAPAKDRLSITVERTSGTLIPHIELQDSNKQRVTSADADPTGARAMVSYVDIPGAGTFNLLVGRYQDKDGKTSGNYRLTVSVLGSAEDNPVLKLNPSPVEYDKPVAGELSNAKWKQGWTLNAAGKDIISITATRTDGTIRPQIDLLDSSGNSITQGYLANTGDYAKLSRFKLPGSGQYTVVVLRENKRDGVSAGKYSLTVTLEGTGPEHPELVKPQGPIAEDATVTGALTNLKWMDVWTLETQAKDNLRIRASRTDGNLLPMVILFGANNQEIQRGYPSYDGSFAQFDVALPGPGKYEVRVARADSENGVTTGKYELSLILLGAGDDSPTFKTSAGNVEVGSAVKGTLTSAKWQDSWTFNATTTDPLTITVKRTSGTLMPHIRILGANQQEINNTYPDATFAAAVFNQFRVPGPGQYTIIVFRNDGARGATSGGYELSVTQGQKQ